MDAPNAKKNSHFFQTHRLILVLGILSAAFFLLYKSYFLQTKQIPLFGNAPEFFLELRSADRFAKCGFLHSLFLPDYNTTNNCDDAPVVYTHMPAGPSIVLGLLRVNNVSAAGTRIVFAIFSYLGVLAFAYFIYILFNSAAAAILASLYLISSFENFLLWSDHFVHSFYWLTLFGALIFATSKSDKKIAKVGLFFCTLLAFATNYFCAISIVISLLFIALIKRGKKDKINISITALAGGIYLSFHAIRNIIFLGYNAAWQDITATLTNRIWGYPSRAALKSFYAKNNIVLWGVEKSSKSTLIIQWISEFSIDNLILLMIFIVFFCKAVLTRNKKTVIHLTIISTTILGIFSWYIFLNAMGKFYYLPYVFHTASALLMATAIACISDEINSAIHWIKANTFTPTLPGALIGIALFVIIEFSFLANSPITDLKNYASYFYMPSKKISEKILSKQETINVLLTAFDALSKIGADKVIWTNIDATIVRYYSPAIAIGSCTPQAFEQTNSEDCYGVFLSNEGEARKLARTPNYFFISSELLHGTMTCGISCISAFAQKISTKLPLIASGTNWWLFAADKLKKKKQNSNKY